VTDVHAMLHPSAMISQIRTAYVTFDNKGKAEITAGLKELKVGAPTGCEACLLFYCHFLLACLNCREPGVPTIALAIVSELVLFSLSPACPHACPLSCRFSRPRRAATLVLRTTAGPRCPTCPTASWPPRSPPPGSEHSRAWQGTAQQGAAWHSRAQQGLLGQGGREGMWPAVTVCRSISCSGLACM